MNSDVGCIKNIKVLWNAEGDRQIKWFQNSKRELYLGSSPELSMETTDESNH